jgi:hypothetical protein
VNGWMMVDGNARHPDGGADYFAGALFTSETLGHQTMNLVTISRTIDRSKVAL